MQQQCPREGQKKKIRPEEEKEKAIMELVAHDRRFSSPCSPIFCSVVQPITCFEQNLMTWFQLSRL